MAGVDETLAETPVDRFALKAAADAMAASNQLPAAHQAPANPANLSDSQNAVSFAPPNAVATATQLSGEASVRTAVSLVGGVSSVDELRQALETFDGCALKKTATNLVFVDGDPKARVMLVGEAPGAEEDRQGVPFVGPSGHLLNKMLASIELRREDVLISNTVFWRPPGNRTPTPQETAICMPFIERLIELVDPDVLIPMGGPAAKSLLGEKMGIGKLRGRWFTYSAPKLARPVAATPLFHPAYLLRTPGQKRAAWHDLLMVRKKLDEKSGD